ncbi:MAG: hypothetical protein IKC65_02545 [Lentisphaeria bacterium]|nr:hypothetical protein [Lentisphaeria bacterium]
MIELYLIFLPAVFAALIALSRKPVVIKILLAVAALLHLAGVIMLFNRLQEDAAALLPGWLEADFPGMIVVCIASALFCAVAIYTLFWLPASRKFEIQYPTMSSHALCSVMCLFLSTMSLTAFAANFGLLWVAVEATTLASAPLIAFRRSRAALEAMWKYLVICSVGIGLALLGTFMLGAAARFSSQGFTDLSFRSFISIKEYLDPQYFKAAFLFCLAGYGLKMGLAPFHVWLPDAYSESPAPVSVLLSGALVNCSFLAIVRVTAAVPEKLQSFCSEYLIGLGILSLFVAACFIIRQKDFKRMLAYSSVEHMGLMAIFWGLQMTDAALLHMIGHSACKMILFFMAGNIFLVYGTKEYRYISGMFSTMPLAACIWLGGMLFICGVPPSPLFTTEIMLIQKAGGVLGLLILLPLFVIFCGMTRTALEMTMGPAGEVPRKEAVPAGLRLSIIPAFLAFIPLAAGIYLIFQL